MQKININAILKIKPKSFGVISDIILKILILLLTLGIVVYSSFDRLFAISTLPDAPTRDELEAGASELPPEYRDLIYEKEYPMALGIYDKLFEDDDVIVPGGELKIVKTDLSKNPKPENVLIKNNTSYSISSSTFLTALGVSIETSGSELPDQDEPLVLIYHTHGTEGYADEGRTSYSPSSLPRSTDVTKNVVAIGKLLSEILNANGIPTIHCETMHDANGNYNVAYSNSAKTVKEYLKKYPSIKYCFDVHRDALVSSTTVYKTLTYDESTPVAQLMFVVGTDNAGANHPNWKRNLSFAVNAQYYLATRLNNLIRPISIKKSSYNQQYPEIGALIEVGTCANTLKEAKAATVILGDILSGMILNNVPLYSKE